MSEILDQTLECAKEILGARVLDLKIERAVVGLFFSGVKLSGGACGLSYTPLKSLSGAVCCPSQASVMPDSGNIAGKSVRYLLRDLGSAAPLKKTLALAALNALGRACFDKITADYDVKFGADPFEQLRIERGSFNVVVGALVPYIKTLMKNGADFKILELDKSTLKQAELPFYLPASEAASVVPRADNVIITATTLINDTLDGLLRLKKSGAKLVLVGPTTPLLPQALFERGVDFAGGTLVRDADAVLDIIAQAGSGYHFLGKFADKITICKG